MELAVNFHYQLPFFQNFLILRVASEASLYEPGMVRANHLQIYLHKYVQSEMSA